MPDIITTHDGRIYPLSRDLMSDPAAIAERMAADMAAAIRAHGFWELAGLEAAGWTGEQIDRHWRAAHELFRSAHPGATTLGQEIVEATANIVAIAIFLGSLLLVLGA